MQRQQVESSVIKSVGYDPALHTLEIEVKSGRVYRYDEVEEKTFKEMMDAKSMGRYFNANIRDKYRGERLEE